MKFRLYKEHGALNSPPIFSAFEEGLLAQGHTVVEKDEDVVVIWSVLFQGRMIQNEKIYNDAKAQGKPVIIIEVGNLIRNSTWRICLDNINGLGKFGNHQDLDPERPKKLGVFLKPYQDIRRGEILIACQHERSLQWKNMPTMKKWVEQTIEIIKPQTRRRIVVRPHPRNLFTVKISNVLMDTPKKVPNTYDDFNIFYGFHCVINFNSGPAVQSLINGTPVICDPSSLAGELSNNLYDIENLQYSPREDWFLKLCHTEWTIEEIRQGIPIQRLTPELEQSLALTSR